MSETVLKPRIPISQDGIYYYSSTSYDQIIMPDRNEWNGKVSSGNTTILNDMTFKELKQVILSEAVYQ